jgi:hypothetical protein
MWTLRDIETLSEGNTLKLGQLWSQVQAAPVKISTRELCDALRGATQVVSLNIRLSEDEARGLLIDDGELISNALGRNTTKP